MSALIFDGKSTAKEIEGTLTHKVDLLRARGIVLRVHVIVFPQDAGSVLYTKLKKAAAERIGIVYEPMEHDLSEDVASLVSAIRSSSERPDVTGVMIQKPTKEVFLSHHPEASDADFITWWQTLTDAIDPHKDVDCLTKINLERIGTSEQRVLPATVAACLSILEMGQALLEIPDEQWQQKSVVVIGRSDIVGKPLFTILAKEFHGRVENWGRAELAAAMEQATETQVTLPFDIVIAAVGKEDLITPDMVQPGVVVIDIGAPNGDVMGTVARKASFMTPVPGGVGPMTVVRLMQSVVDMIH